MMLLPIRTYHLLLPHFFSKHLNNAEVKEATLWGRIARSRLAGITLMIGTLAVGSIGIAHGDTESERLSRLRKGLTKDGISHTGVKHIDAYVDSLGNAALDAASPETASQSEPTGDRGPGLVTQSMATLADELYGNEIAGFDRDLLENDDFDILVDSDRVSGERDAEYLKLETNTTAERTQLKTQLINALADLEWRLRVPVVEIDSKIVLLKSYLKSLLGFYEQIRTKKVEYDDSTKDTVRGILELTKDKYRNQGLAPGEVERNVLRDLQGNERFQRILKSYLLRSARFHAKAELVVIYIREIDHAISELKIKRNDMEMYIISQQMDERLETILGEVRKIDPNELVSEAEQVELKREDMELEADEAPTSDDVARFLLELGF